MLKKLGQFYEDAKYGFDCSRKLKGSQWKVHKGGGGIDCSKSLWEA